MFDDMVPTLGDLAAMSHFERDIERRTPHRPAFIAEGAEHDKRALHIAGVLNKIDYRARMIRWAIYRVKYLSQGFESPFFNVTAYTRVNDVVSGDPIELQMESFEVSPTCDDKQIVQIAWRLLDRFEHHEAAEHFFYQGSKPFDPHK